MRKDENHDYDLEVHTQKGEDVYKLKGKAFINKI
jgi:hypothetical protein